jgi:type I restriction enzyme, S subunit
MEDNPSNFRLGNSCIKIGSGATPRGGNKVYLPKGVSLIRSQNVYNHGFFIDGLVFIGEKHAAQLDNVSVEDGDVLLNITGDSVARCCQVAKEILPARVNQHVAIIRPKPNELDAAFLRYYLISPYMQEHMLMLASSGATRKALTKGMIEDFEIPKFSYDYQQAIAEVLGSFDDKIELNRRMNKTFESLARAIYKNWFVDFDPVHAKAEGRQPAGMDAETAALFPDSFEMSSLGEIPRGWKVVPFPDAIEVNPSRPLKKGENAPYLAMANMPKQGHRAIQWEDRLYGSGTKFKNGDTLLARITPSLEHGKTAFVDFLAEDQIGWGSTEYIVLRSRSPLPVEYGYYLARSNDLRSHAIMNMTGTSGRQRVPSSCFDNHMVVLPPESIASRFGDFVITLMAKIRAIDEQSRTLASLRDALLLQLMSGTLKLKVQEKET